MQVLLQVRSGQEILQEVQIKHLALLRLKRGKDSGWHIFDRPLGLVLIVLYKGLWGLSELVIGGVVYFSRSLIAAELAEDPQDLLINWIMRGLHPNLANAHQYGSLIIFLGIAKIALAVGLWYRSYLIRNIGVGIFSALSLYGAFQVVVSFSLMRSVYLIVDIVILYYFWRILPKHIRHLEVE